MGWALWDWGLGDWAWGMIGREFYFFNFFSSGFRIESCRAIDLLLAYGASAMHHYLYMHRMPFFLGPKLGVCKIHT